jgi:hypothetical protein
VVGKYGASIRDLNNKQMKKRLKLKKVKPIIKHKDGSIEYNLDSDAGNADWIRTARLLKAGKTEEAKKLFNTPMYYLEDDENESE